jgi:hypothetical protein
MVIQQVQGASCGAVCNQTELSDWQNVIPYGERERDNVVIVRSHGSLTDKCYHRNCRTQKANEHGKCRV